MTPKTSLSTTVSSPTTPASSRPLIAASTRNISMPLQSHVGLANEFVVLQLARAACQANGADLEQIGAVDHLEHLLDVLFDDEDREPFRANAADEIENFLHHERSQPRGRLVHQQEPRPRHQCAANRAHLLLAPRERASRLLAPLLQPRKQLVDPSQLFGKMRACFRNESADPEIVLDAEFWKQTAVFRNVGDSALHDAMGGHAGNRSDRQ